MRPAREGYLCPAPNPNHRKSKSFKCGCPVEPQNDDTTSNIYVDGGTYSVIQALETVTSGRAIMHLLLQNLTIGTLNYGGAHWKMSNCTIADVIDVGYGETRFFGELDFELWKIMHSKHITHHLEQFGIGV